MGHIDLNFERMPSFQPSQTMAVLLGLHIERLGLQHDRFHDLQTFPLSLPTPIYLNEIHLQLPGLLPTGLNSLHNLLFSKGI